MHKIGFAALIAVAVCAGTGAAFAASEAKTGYADVNGLHMYYEVRGEGQPTLVLHGAYMSADSMGPFIAELASRAGATNAVYVTTLPSAIVTPWFTRNPTPIPIESR